MYFIALIIVVGVSVETLGLVVNKGVVFHDMGKVGFYEGKHVISLGINKERIVENLDNVNMGIGKIMGNVHELSIMESK